MGQYIEKLTCIVSIVDMTNWMDLYKFIGNFALTYFCQLYLVLQWNFILFLFFMPNENMIMVTKLHLSNNLHN